MSTAMHSQEILKADFTPELWEKMKTNYNLIRTSTTTKE
jgi:hypothetical protein